jgi:D-glycero-D-manno-heptose 1,7-bisphosphate phosphatase
MQEKKRTVFFDRDGVILKVVIENGVPRPPQSVAEYEERSGMMPGVREAILAVQKAGFLAILATNQPDIHYGEITKEDFGFIQGKVAALPFDDIFICFHGREEGCACKKPKPGMLLEAAKKWNIDLSRSFMVGDSAADVGAARAAGCKSVLVNASYNTVVVSDIRIHSLTELSRVISLE